MAMAQHKQLIFLTGQMGSGKSYLGKKLAENLGIDFIDTDTWIVQRENKSVSSIFQQYGESYFRQLELDIFHQITELEHTTLIATGGGFPCFNNLAQAMYDKGLVVHLKTALPVLIQNLKDQTKQRPLLKHISNLADFLSEQYESRMDCYQKAHILVNLEERIDHISVLEARLEPFFNTGK